MSYCMYLITFLKNKGRKRHVDMVFALKLTKQNWFLNVEKLFGTTWKVELTFNFAFLIYSFINILFWVFLKELKLILKLKKNCEFL